MPLPFCAASFRRLRLAAIIVSGLWVAVSWGQATDPDAIRRLLREGRTADALVGVEQALQARPQDLQLRFLRAVVLTEQNKLDEAAAQYLRLIEDRPDVPEVYNNLAVIYSRQEQYEKARQALEMAVRLQPRFAQAHENLGDVYAKLAGQAYARALEQQPGHPGLSVKLTLVRELFTPGRLPPR
ncbi:MULTISPECIES: tetratricopeptide repeat protein [Caldimonas]|uniref:tetratricopeptide repeat protein n=1 Tax=Caldimonas TaxID=196013 RepID=UPI000375E0F4|nr:tetratricopeptide repeat protein [Caldimonas manganoxidans]